MSSCVISSRSNINKTINQEDNEPEEILNQGIEKIYHSFNVNNQIYKEKINENENIIISLTKKLEMLNNEMEMLQRENLYYKTQNENLKKEVEKLNKIVKKIQGKLSNVDYQINECIKSGINLKSLNFKKKKNSNLYINMKNKEKESKSLFQLNPNNFLIEEKGQEEEKIGKYNNNKSTKNKKLVYYIDNNILKENGNKKNTKLEYEINSNNLTKKFNKTVGFNSFDLNMNINETKNNKNKKDEKKVKTPNSVLYKNVLLKEEKKKKNLENIDNEQPQETSVSCQDNNKNRSYSSKQFLKDNIINNKTTDELDINTNFINNEDLNVDKISPISNNKGIEGQICLTYDNLFTKKNIKKKNSYTSFRGKILNKNISENIFKNENNKMNKTDEINFFLKKCKMMLNKEYFEQIVKLFQDYKDGLLTDEGIIIKTQRYLESNTELIELFNKVFRK